VKQNYSSTEYGATLVKHCREGLSAVLPFISSEQNFLNKLLDEGEICPAFLTSDAILQKRIQSQPLLKWKSINVRKHRGLS